MQRDQQSPGFVWLVGITSIIPFWIFAYAAYRPVADFSSVTALALTPIYGGVYLGLLGGAKWGLVSAGRDISRPALQMLMGLLFVLAGFATVVMPAIIGLSILNIFFVAAGLWDLTHGLSGKTAFWYTRMRVWITILAVAPLVGLLLRVL